MAEPTGEEKRKLCEMTHHEWKEEYYGYKCETCGEFIPYGCEPWIDDNSTYTQDFDEFSDADPGL